MSNFNSDSASLTYLTNPLYQQILKKQDSVKSQNKTSIKEDIKFYRKRITSITKEMLKNTYPNKEVRAIYENYVEGLINYFKIQDTADIIQKQYGDTKNTLEENNDNIVEENTSDRKSNNITDIESNNITELNERLIRKIPSVPNLDNFVIKQNQENEQDKRIIPLILEVNLKDPSLKKKGVREKKNKLQNGVSSNKCDKKLVESFNSIELENNILVKKNSID